MQPSYLHKLISIQPLALAVSHLFSVFTSRLQVLPVSRSEHAEFIGPLAIYSVIISDVTRKFTLGGLSPFGAFPSLSFISPPLPSLFSSPSPLLPSPFPFPFLSSPSP